MSNEPETKPKTVAAFIKRVPPYWQDAEMCLGTDTDRIFRMKQIAFIENTNGQKVVCIFPNFAQVWVKT